MPRSSILIIVLVVLLLPADILTKQKSGGKNGRQGGQGTTDPTDDLDEATDDQEEGADDQEEGADDQEEGADDQEEAAGKDPPDDPSGEPKDDEKLPVYPDGEDSPLEETGMSPNNEPTNDDPSEDGEEPLEDDKGPPGNTEKADQSGGNADDKNNEGGNSEPKDGEEDGEDWDENNEMDGKTQSAADSEPKDEETEGKDQMDQKTPGALDGGLDDYFYPEEDGGTKKTPGSPEIQSLRPSIIDSLGPPDTTIAKQTLIKGYHTEEESYQKCEANDIPVEELYLMTEYIEDYFDGETSYKEVERNLDGITVHEETCHEAFNVLKNVSYEMLETTIHHEHSTKEKIDLIYKTLIRILNEKLKELILTKNELVKTQEEENEEIEEVTKEEHVVDLRDELITLTAYEVDNGRIGRAADRVEDLRKHYVSVSDVIERAYNLDYLRNILKFLERLPDSQMEGTRTLFDAVMDDERLDNSTGMIFDSYLEKFAKTPGRATRPSAYVYSGMRYKLRERINLRVKSDYDKSAVVAQEIQKGNGRTAYKTFKDLGNAPIADVVRGAYSGDGSVVPITEFLGHLPIDMKVDGSIALLDMIEKNEIHTEDEDFRKFLIRAEENNPSRKSRLVYAGIQSKLIPDVVTETYSTYEEETEEIDERMKPTSLTCFNFRDGISRLDFDDLLPPRNKAWSLTFSFRTITAEGLLLGADDVRYAFSLFLKNGALCISTPSKPCSNSLKTYDDGTWHHIIVRYYVGGDLDVFIDELPSDTTRRFIRSTANERLKSRVARYRAVSTIRNEAISTLYLGSLPGDDYRRDLGFRISVCEKNKLITGFEGDIKDVKLDGRSVPPTRQINTGHC